MDNIGSNDQEYGDFGIRKKRLGYFGRDRKHDYDYDKSGYDDNDNYSDPRDINNFLSSRNFQERDNGNDLTSQRIDQIIGRTKQP